MKLLAHLSKSLIFDKVRGTERFSFSASLKHPVMETNTLQQHSFPIPVQAPTAHH